MTTPENRRLPAPVEQPSGPSASAADRVGLTALPAASFGSGAPRARSFAPAVTMKMPR